LTIYLTIWFNAMLLFNLFNAQTMHIK
jgi:hypothetical protein